MSIGFFFSRATHRPLARLSQSIERLTREQEQVRALAQAQADELLLEQQKIRALLASLPVTVVEYNGLGEGFKWLNLQNRISTSRELWAAIASRFLS
jgi:hypothetical protein